MRAVLVGTGSGLLVGALALVAVVGSGWPVDHRALLTAADTRPVTLPATFAGLPDPVGPQEMAGLLPGGRPAQTSMYSAREPVRAVGVAVARGWTTGDSERVDGPEVRYGEVTCVSPATMTLPPDDAAGPDGEATVVRSPLYCERLSSTLSVSAFVLFPTDAAPVAAEQLAAEVDALWLAHR